MTTTKRKRYHLILASPATDPTIPSSLGTAILHQLTQENPGEEVVCLVRGSTLEKNLLDVLEVNQLEGKSIGTLVICFEETNNEKRRMLNSLQEFDEQYRRLMDNDAAYQFQLVFVVLPYILRFSRMEEPCTIVFLGSRMVRTPNSPQQIVPSISKRSVQSFAGSLFFERRHQGVRCCYVNPVPGIPDQELAKAMTFPTRVAHSTCVESVDMSLIKAPTRRAPSSYAGAIFVTGGSRGIGANIAKACAEQLKFCVALVGRDKTSLESSRAECARHVGDRNVMTYEFDVRDDEKMKRAIDDASAKFGGLTALVNSAGINRRRNAVSPDGTKFADPKLWNELIDINVKATFSATGYALPHMVRTGLTSSGGIAPAIFFISSRAIRLGGSPGQQSYVASKMAITGFCNSIQHEVKPFGIRCCSLNVGLVATELGTRAPSSGKFKPAPPEWQIQPEDLSLACLYVLRAPGEVAITSYDMNATYEDFVDAADGKALKLSNL